MTRSKTFESPGKLLANFLFSFFIIAKENEILTSTNLYTYFETYINKLIIKL